MRAGPVIPVLIVDQLAHAVPEAIVGVGTLSKIEVFAAAIAAGARFGVAGVCRKFKRQRRSVAVG